MDFKERVNNMIDFEKIIDKFINKDQSPDEHFMDDSNIANLGIPRRRSHLILFIIIAILVIFLIWAYFAKLDEVTRGNGKVIPSSSVQVIQNLEGGIVRQILVREGQQVKKGQILLILDDTRFASENREGVLKGAALRARVWRLEAESEGKELKFSEDFKKKYSGIVDNEEDLYNSRKKELETKVSTLKTIVSQTQHELATLKDKRGRIKKSLELVEKELGMTKPLVGSGAVSQVEVLRLERQVNDLAGELSAAELSIPRLQEQLAENNGKIAEVKVTFQTEAYNDLSKTEAEMTSQGQVNLARKDRVERTVVRSPVNGTVNKVAIKTVGGVIKPGMDLMDIVPNEDSLLVEAKIRPADVAFLRPGQKAMVKFTAYDFSIYGGLKGVLEHISPNTIEDDEGNSFYEIRVRTNKAFLGTKAHPLPIIAGMTADVDILTGEKSVLDYLLKPILKTKQRALRER